MKIFAIGDPHLSLGADKPMDVFPGWENYVERLCDNWSRTVCPEDVVVIAGDISWALKLEEAKEDFAFLHRLNGTKILLKGNHDLWFSTRRKIEAFFQENGLDTLKLLHNSFYPVGEYGLCGTRGWINEFEEASDRKIVKREAGRLECSLKACAFAGKNPIVFLHYPPLSLKTECEEILDVIERYHVQDVYYGHLHGTAHQYAAKGSFRGVRYHLISCDFTDFSPVLVKDLNNS